MLTLGVLLSKLVESQNFTTVFDNSSSGRFSDSEGTDSKLGDLEESDVVGDSRDDNGSSVGVTLQVLNNSWQADGISNSSRLVKSFINGLVERTISSSGQESI